MKKLFLRSIWLMLLLPFIMLDAEESFLSNQPVGISLYQPNYILPYFYMTNPDQEAYESQPTYPTLSKNAISFQFSLKYPLWKITNESTLNIAYTQMSFWQAYQKSPFFAETDYEPEIFLANEVNWPIGGSVKAQFLNVGLVHQSNG